MNKLTKIEFEQRSKDDHDWHPLLIMTNSVFKNGDPYKLCDLLQNKTQECIKSAKTIGVIYDRKESIIIKVTHDVHYKEMEEQASELKELLSNNYKNWFNQCGKMPKFKL